MANKEDFMDYEIRRKRKLIRSVCKNKLEKNELLDQVEVCEMLCQPLSDNKLIELAKLPLQQIKCEIWKHKFA